MPRPETGPDNPEPTEASSAEADATVSKRQPGDSATWIIIVAGGIFAQLLFTINGVLAARMLGVEGRGQVVLVATLAMTASQLTLGGGLPNALTKLLADRGVTARDGLTHLVPQWLLISLIPAGIGSAFLLYLERATPGNTKYALAAALAVMAIQTMALRMLIGVMLGEGTPLLSLVITNLAPQAVITAAMAAAFAFGVRLSAVELLAVMIGSAVAASIVRLFALRKATGEPGQRIPSRAVWSLARKTHVGSVGPIDGLSIDRTLVGSLLGNSQLGLYSAAFALAGLTNIIGGSLAMVVLPRVAAAQAEPSTEPAVVRKWLIISAALITGSVIALEIVAAPTIRIAFGDEFVGATTCAYWLIAAGGFLSFRRVQIAVLQGRGKGGWASWIEIGLAPLVVLGVWFASSADSLVGVGVTMTVVGAVSCLMLAVAVPRSRQVTQVASPS